MADGLQESWVIEGLARYYEWRYNEFFRPAINKYWNECPQVPEDAHIREYRAWLGRDIDVTTDYPDLMDLLCYLGDIDDPNADDGYTPGCSFINYLIKRFGEEKVLEMILVTHDFAPYTYEALVEDWQVYLSDRYGSFTKAEK